MNFNALLKSFRIQPDLNRKIWDSNNMLNPKIREALLRIARTFYDSLELEKKPTIKDIVFTGSLANYNYSDSSDIDLHLLFDFSELKGDTSLIEQFFLLAKSNWNDNHSIKIKGYDVEIYAEDQKNKHVSTGLYSVLQNKWLKAPQKMEPIFDPANVKSKVDYIVKLYNHFEELYRQGDTKDLYTKISNLRDKLGKYRQAGLDSGGEFSTENITFKALRRLGILDKLRDIQLAVTDKKLSVKEIR